MTEIALRQDASMIQLAAQDMSAAHALAKALVSTSFVPQHFKGKPDEAAAAIMYGATIDMAPLIALANIHVISGKPGLYARTMVALVKGHGHKIWTEENGPTKVIVCGQRKGETEIERSEWTVERARKAGYTTNKKYDTDPESMLYARAAGDVSRRVAPDALLGLAYSVEELEQEPGGEAEPVAAARSGLSRLTAAVMPTPTAEDAAEPTPEVLAQINAEAEPDELFE